MRIFSGLESLHMVGEPGGLPSMGSCGVGHNWSDIAAAAPFYFQMMLGCWGIPMSWYANSVCFNPLENPLLFFDVHNNNHIPLNVRQDVPLCPYLDHPSEQEEYLLLILTHKELFAHLHKFPPIKKEKKKREKWKQWQEVMLRVQWCLEAQVWFWHT